MAEKPYPLRSFRPEPVQPDVEQSAGGQLPVEGQEYRDGFSPGYTWLVSWIEDGFAWLTCMHNGEVTAAYLRWPLNRWAALLDKQKLELVP